MRPLTTEPIIGEVTQGAVFNCLRLDGDDSTYGLVISAKCDIAHRKSKTVLCLPLFRLEKWMADIGRLEILMQCGKAATNLVAEILSKYGVAKEALKIYGYDSTLSVLESKKINKADLDKLVLLRPYIEKNEIVPQLKAFKEANNKLLETLWRNTRADAHFLERIFPDEPAAGYVVDFTQPITIYRDVIDELSLGLEKYKYDREIGSRYSSLKFGESEYGEFVSVIVSPYIEHILQRFTHFYSRIGTQDIAEHDLHQLKGKYEIA
jgi:hypothetical protein